MFVPDIQPDRKLRRKWSIANNSLCSHFVVFVLKSGLDVQLTPSEAGSLNTSAGLEKHSMFNIPKCEQICGNDSYKLGNT
jgi:hypothetical protein